MGSIALVAAAAAAALLFIARGRSGAVRPARGIERLEALEGTTRPENGVSGRRPGGRPYGTLLELPHRAAPERLRRFMEAGLPELVSPSGLSLAHLAGMRAWGCAGMPVAALLATRFSALGVAAAVPLASLGWMLPQIVASRRRLHYLESARRGLPDTADLLFAYVLGGKNLEQAFRGAAGSSSGPLGAQLAQAVREMDLGASREEAFANLLERCPLKELSSLLRSLLEAERRGHALSETLEVYAREIRLRRRDELRVAVAKAPLKMLAPLVFLILPASVLLTVGPTFLATLRGIL